MGVRADGVLVARVRLQMLPAAVRHSRLLRRRRGQQVCLQLKEGNRGLGVAAGRGGVQRRNPFLYTTPQVQPVGVVDRLG